MEQGDVNYSVRTEVIWPKDKQPDPNAIYQKDVTLSKGSTVGSVIEAAQEAGLTVPDQIQDIRAYMCGVIYTVDDLAPSLDVIIVKGAMK
jgi:hypothetical protein